MIFLKKNVMLEVLQKPILPKEKDIYFMQLALKEAQKAFDKKEVPVGAVLVFQDKVIAKGHNQIELLRDATAHAEMLCLSSGFVYFDNWRLSDTTLYCTLEPCVMCAGAIINARVKRLVWGAKDVRVGANGSFLDIFAENHPIHELEVQGNILADESSYLLKTFFQKTRKAKDKLSSHK